MYGKNSVLMDLSNKEILNVVNMIIDESIPQQHEM